MVNILEKLEENNLQETQENLEVIEEVVILDSEPDVETTCSNYTF